MKIKKIISAFLVIAITTMSTAIISVNATEVEEKEVFTCENYRYTKDIFNTAEIVEYIGTNPDRIDLVVPDRIDGRIVTSIGYEAFWRANIKSVTLPDSITKIDDYAFYGSEYLKSVDLPDNLQSIGKSAFSDCYELESIVIPSKVTYMGENTFRWCKNMKSVVIPESLTTIPAYAFEECRALENVSLPDSVTEIGDNAFYATYNLTSIDLPANLKTTGRNIFMFSGLTSITIPSSLKNVSYYSFSSCYDLKSIIIEEGVEEISNGAFASTHALTEVILPESIKKINVVAFAGCSELKKVRIPSEVEILPNSFVACNQDLVLFSDENSTAKTYATDNNHKFIAIGDVNTDGAVNIKDATLLQMSIANLETLEGNQIFAADVKCDENNDINDVTEIQKYLAEIN